MKILKTGNEGKKCLPPSVYEPLSLSLQLATNIVYYDQNIQTEGSFLEKSTLKELRKNTSLI
jgi:hypothetical protein